MKSRCAAAGALIAALLAGCAPASVTVTAPETVALLPSTSTPRPTPVPPTVTPQQLTSPEDLQTQRPDVESTPEVTGDSLVDVDPVAAGLITAAQRALADQLGVPIRRVQLIGVDAIVWPDTSLGCPQPGLNYAQTEVSGYRIVLQVGTAQSIFHTDFDRVFLCAAEDEVLPASQVTDEATDDS